MSKQTQNETATGRQKDGTYDKKQGFVFGDHRIYFTEGKGKDISFDRWRMCLYYEPHLALTEFFRTEKAYNEFLANSKKCSYESYAEFRSDWDSK